MPTQVDVAPAPGPYSLEAHQLRPCEASAGFARQFAEPLAALAAELSRPRRILITTHHKPDADALGSSLGMARYLERGGHRVTVLSPSDFPRFLSWMVGQERVLNADELPEGQIRAIVNEAELILCLDFSALSRINALGAIVGAAKATRVVIDHHLEPEPIGQITFWDSGAGATCELVYLLIEAMAGTAAIDPPLADCLYAGIMTDTGSFRHASTSPRVHQVAAALLWHGARASEVHRLVYDQNRESRLRFMGYCLYRKLVHLPQYRTAYLALTQQELRDFGVETGETEGIVNWALSIEGVVLAAIIVDRGEAIKLSFRSVGDFSVRELACRYFDGGGHHNASGGRSEKTLEQVVADFEALLPLYADELMSAPRL